MSTGRPKTDGVRVASAPTPADYKREREKRGLTQAQLAAKVGVHRLTISKRERGAADAPITREAWLALLSLPECKRAGLFTPKCPAFPLPRSHPPTMSAGTARLH